MNLKNAKWREFRKNTFLIGFLTYRVEIHQKSVIGMRNNILDLSHHYVRKGSKKNRRRVIGRLSMILLDIQQHETGVNAPDNVGRAHIVRFYCRNSDKSPRTLNDYFYALNVMWGLLGRIGEPPRPPRNSE